MTVTICPAATIKAPIERVWSLLMDPRKWTDWSTARLEAAKPDGPLQAGQRLYFSSPAFGKRWHAVTSVTSVAVERTIWTSTCRCRSELLTTSTCLWSACLTAGRTCSSVEIFLSRPGGGDGWSSTYSDENSNGAPEEALAGLKRIAEAYTPD
jgi:uncharacterized protein YndB with AHSA1/START domain